MNYTSKVTIAVPVYGVEKYIKRCARSLFEQTYQDIEYLFVDDCSPDKSIDILREVIDDYPVRKPHVRIISHEKNRGLSAARNTAVTNTFSEFLLHVDSDDYIDLFAVEKLVQKQMQTNADIVSCGYVEDYSKCSIPHKSNFPQTNDEWVLMVLQRKIQCNIWGRLIRHSLLIDNHINCIEGCNMGEDFQVIPRLFYYAKNISYIEDYAYHYNCMNIGSYTKVFSEKESRQSFQGLDLIKDFFKNKDEKYKDAIQQGEAYMLAMNMVSCARSGNREYFNILQDRMRKMGKQYVVNIPLNYRLTYYISNYYILHSYCEFGHLIKRFKTLWFG